MDRVALFRLLHIAGAVLLLGNVTVTGLWAVLLYRERAAVPFRPVARAILWADLWFTVGGGFLLVFSGIQLILARGYPFWDTPWLLHGVAALAGSTLLWLVVLLPTQVRMARAPEGQDLRREFRRWSIVGWLATALLFVGLWAMVVRG